MKGLLILSLLVVFSCSSSSFDEPSTPLSQPGKQLDNGWSISTEKVQDAGIGKDGIRALENPSFIAVNEVDFLLDDELVTVMNVGGQTQIFPHRIMDLHEVANIKPGNNQFSLTFCPLTGSAIGFDGNLETDTTSFGVSGFLYNSNLILYDRTTNSLWSQMLLSAVNGPRVCERVSQISAIDMPWVLARQIYPNGATLDKNTGHPRRYQNPPLSFINDLNKSPTFPVSPIDDRMPNYERVHAIIIDNQAFVYRFEQFEGEANILRDNIAGKEVLIIGSHEHNVLFSLNVPPALFDAEFSATIGPSEIKITDSEGHEYSLFGALQNGSEPETLLTPTTSFIAYWFALSSIYVEPEIRTTESDS